MNVADPTSPGESARPDTASTADRTASADASLRSVPASAAERSTRAAAWAAASDASWGRAEVDTPSQTTATRTGPPAAGHDGELHRVFVLLVPQAAVGHAGHQAEIELLVIMRHHGTTPGPPRYGSTSFRSAGCA